MSGELAVLSVGEGDMKFSFDKAQPAEVIRARRVVADMLRRGYALLVEVERGGEKRFERVQRFDEATDSYVIADFDPQYDPSAPEIIAVRKEVESEQGQGAKATGAAETPVRDAAVAKPKRGRPLGSGKGRRSGVKGGGTRKIPAFSAKAIAVGRSAGG